jgi:hypothetical protein
VLCDAQERDDAAMQNQQHQQQQQLIHQQQQQQQQLAQHQLSVLRENVARLEQVAYDVWHLKSAV